MKIEIWDNDWFVGEFTSFTELHNALFKDNLSFTTINLVKGDETINISDNVLSIGA
jgi:hypothetical protein